MTSDYHTPHAANEALTAANQNAPLGELDSAIGALFGRTTWVDVVADDVTDNSAVLQAAADSADFGTVIAVRPTGTGKIGLGSTVTFSKQGTRLVGRSMGVATSGGTIFKCLNNLGSAPLLLWRPTLSTDIMEGSGAENFNVDMDGKTGHGIEVDRAYNSTMWSNIRVFNVADAYNAWRFTYVPGAAAVNKVSQGILALNLWGQHQNDTATQAAFFIQRAQESIFIGCKGWGGGGSNAAGDWPFYVEDCRGVQFYGCSAAASSVGGFNIVCKLLAVQNITIDAPTFELCGDGATDPFVRTGAPIGTATYSAAVTYAVDDVVVDVAGGDSYVSIQAGNIAHTPSSNPSWWTPTTVQRCAIRAPRFQSPNTGRFEFDQSLNGTYETAGQTVLLKDNSDNNHIISSRADLVTLGGGVGNSLFGTTFFQSGKLYAPFLGVTNPGVSAVAAGVFLGTTSGATGIFTGTGSPAGVVVANPGSLYLRTDGGAGTTLYVKESLTTSSGWVAK